jgi:hypothetical protein
MFHPYQRGSMLSVAATLLSIGLLLVTTASAQ